VVTQVVVSREDPAFRIPASHRPFYTMEEAEQHQAQDGWTVKEDAGARLARVVPSPKPLEIIEEDAIRTLLDNDIVVIAVGAAASRCSATTPTTGGCAAVIDKDLGVLPAGEESAGRCLRDLDRSGSGRAEFRQAQPALH
jgi:carbamate kinase